MFLCLALTAREERTPRPPTGREPPIRAKVGGLSPSPIVRRSPLFASLGVSCAQWPRRPVSRGSRPPVKLMQLCRLSFRLRRWLAACRRLTKSFTPSISDSGRSCPVCGIRDAKTMLYGRWRRLIVPSARRSQIASAAVSTFPRCAGMTQHLNRLHLPIPAPGAVPSLRTGHCRARSPRCLLAPPPPCWPLCISHQAWRWRMFMPLARKSPGD